MGKLKTVRITRSNALSFVTFMSEYELERVPRRSFVGIGLLNEEERSCGALCGHREDSYIFIDSLVAAPEVGNEGKGQLVGALKALMGSLGANDLKTVLAFPAEREEIAFFYSVGFFEAGETGRVYFLPTESIISSGILERPATPQAGCITEFGKLSAAVRGDYRLLVGKELEKYLSFEQLPGKRIDEASLVCTVNDRVCAILGSVELPTGEPYIASLWAKGKEGSVELLPMIVRALGRLCKKYPRSRVCVNAATASGLKLIERLISGREQMIEVQSNRLLQLKNDEEDKMSVLDMAIPGEAFIMPKLSALQERLEQLSISGDIIIKNDAMPYVSVQLPKHEVTAMLTYYPVREDSSEQYLLELYCAVECSGDNDPLTYILGYNSTSMGPVASLSSNGEYYLLRYVVPEFGATIDEGTLKMALDIFSEAADTIKRA